MKISFVAGFGPIAPDVDASYRFYHEGLGIEFEGDREYWHTDGVEGVNAFSIWPLTEAAKACFGTADWPDDIPLPQAWLEFDVDNPAAVAQAADDLESNGYSILVPAREEPWGQTVARLLSPESILLGIAYTPWMHRVSEDAAKSSTPAS